MSPTKKFAVILSGCGVYDGSEIHETTMTLYAIMKYGGSYEIFAPDMEQYHVMNHLTGEEMHERRNVLVESARIARGKIKPLAVLNPDQFDALIFPGGFGAAKNLCTYAFEGVDCKVIPEVATVIKKMHQQKKPIGALCISPVIIASVLGKVELTIGQDEKTATDITKMGATHKKTTHGEVIRDEKNKIYTTPCYMLDANILQIAEGAENVIQAIMKD